MKPSPGLGYPYWTRIGREQGLQWYPLRLCERCSRQDAGRLPKLSEPDKRKDESTKRRVEMPIVLTLCPCTSRADIIGGRSPSNCTSTTAPITCVTLPSNPVEALVAAKPLDGSDSGEFFTAAHPEIPPTEGENPLSRENDVVPWARNCFDKRPATREKRHIVKGQCFCTCQSEKRTNLNEWKQRSLSSTKARVKGWLDYC